MAVQQDIELTPSHAPFKLTDKFLEPYKTQKPPFGFGALSELVYYRTYSRIKSDGTNEQWWETIRRVVEGTYNMQRRWIELHNLGWNAMKAQKSAQEMYHRMYTMKFLPPGRGLWAMGSAMTEERGIFACLFNCAFVSTRDLANDPTMPFCFLCDMSMLGVGVGFDTSGAGSITIHAPLQDRASIQYVIPDTREGWVESLRLLLDSYFVKGRSPVEFDYSQIRPAGQPIKGFGGVSSGAEPLFELHNSLRSLLDPLAGSPITARVIVDVMNMIGCMVVAGNVRRTAEIALGSPFDSEYLDLKNYTVNPERAAYGWTSNNSILAEVGMDYRDICDRTERNGEPGYIWLKNAQDYSRMNDGPDFKDNRILGCNPCFSGPTLIGVADGRGAVPIEKLAEEGRDVPVYSLTPEGMIEIQWGRHPRVTGYDQKLLRVTLDDGTFLDVTPNHPMLLLDGGKKAAADLSVGDSLPRFSKKLDKVMDGDNNSYLQVSCNVHDATAPGSRVYEHRLIAQFHNPAAWNAMYKTATKDRNGVAVTHEFVIHHKDENTLNNSPDNLEFISFSEHSRYHDKVNFSGADNPMYGRKHSEETKALIGESSAERWEDEEFRRKVMAGHAKPENKKIYAENMSRNVRKRNAEYYAEQEATTDLETTRIDGNLYAIRYCEACGTKMVLPWRIRETAYCSHSCANTKQEAVEARKEGLRTAFKEKSAKTLHAQIGVFQELTYSLGRQPMKKEWENECRSRGVSFRLNPHSENPNVPKSYGDLIEKAASYNHRVVKVEELPGLHTVYNITVDENHTVAIVTDFNKDYTCSGVISSNCGEQSLESQEMCCLVEVYPYRHDSMEDYKRTLKFAYLYGKTVTLAKTHWPDTNRIMLRNRRIGLSHSGIQQFIAREGIETYRQWCEEGYKTIAYYDKVYSEWLCVPESKKTTSVKPSGTISKLAGATPGAHWPEALYMIRRVRLAKGSDLVAPLREAGYKVEPCVGQEDSTVVVEIPLAYDNMGGKLRSAKTVSMWEHLAMAAFLQKYWADNQVSYTVSFDPETDKGQLANALNYYQYQLKGVSFLPRLDYGAFPQMPEEEITQEKYEELAKSIKPVDFQKIEHEEADAEKFCTNDHCSI